MGGGIFRFAVLAALVLLIVGFVSCGNPNNDNGTGGSGGSGGGSTGGGNSGGSEKTLVAKYSQPNVGNGEISIKFYSDKSVENYSKLNGDERILLKGTYKLTGDWDNGTVDVSWDFGSFTDHESLTIANGVLKDRSGTKYNKVDNNGTSQTSGNGSDGNNSGTATGNSGGTSSGGTSTEKEVAAKFYRKTSTGQSDTFWFYKDSTYKDVNEKYPTPVTGTYSLEGDWNNGTVKILTSSDGDTFGSPLNITSGKLRIRLNIFDKVD